MPGLIVYLLKVNAALCLFYLAYRFALRPLTFYYLNRFFLVSGIVFSTVYPLINVSALFADHTVIRERLTTFVPDWHAVLPAVQRQAATVDYWGVPIMLFWLGVILMAFRLAVQFMSLYRIRRQSVPTHHQGESFRAVESDVNPFSFWQDIYLNPEKHTDAELRSIIRHEQVHVKQWHTLDVLLAELSVVFYWFNPGVWFMKQAVKENLEFITDREILRSGVDEKAYQYSLVRVSALKPGAAIVNNFNFLTIKKRIMMMNKKRSSRANLTRYVVLPLIMLLTLIFTLSKAEIASKNISVLVKKILPASMPGKLSAANNFITPKAKRDTVKPKIVKDTAVRLTIIQRDGKDGTDTLINGSDKKVLRDVKVIRINGDDVKPGSKDVIVLDDKGKPTTLTLSAVSPDAIESIRVLKDTASVKAYSLSTDPKNQIVVKLKPMTSISTSTKTLTSFSTGASGSSQRDVIIATGDAAPKAYTIDVRGDDDELVYAIDPRNLNTSEIEKMRKAFKKDGFDLKVHQDFDGDKLKTISITVSSDHKHSTASATYTADDLKKDGDIIRIEADKSTGGVSVMSHRR